MSNSEPEIRLGATKKTFRGRGESYRHKKLNQVDEKGHDEASGAGDYHHQKGTSNEGAINHQNDRTSNVGQHNSALPFGSSSQSPSILQPAATPTQYSIVIAPQDYPDHVINENSKSIILDWINDGIKAKAARFEQEDIIIDRVMYRSGVLILSISDLISFEWIHFTVSDRKWENSLGFNIKLTTESAFEFADAFTVWVPDEKANFEWLKRKANLNRINTSSWRFIRIITEKNKMGSVHGRKFAFVANNLLERLLDDKHELRFNYDAFQQKAIIKGTRSVGAAGPSSRFRHKVLINKFSHSFFSFCFTFIRHPSQV